MSNNTDDTQVKPDTLYDDIQHVKLDKPDDIQVKPDIQHIKPDKPDDQTRQIRTFTEAKPESNKPDDIQVKPDKPFTPDESFKMVSMHGPHESIDEKIKNLQQQKIDMKKEKDRAEATQKKFDADSARLRKKTYQELRSKIVKQVESYGQPTDYFCPECGARKLGIAQSYIVKHDSLGNRNFVVGFDKAIIRLRKKDGNLFCPICGQYFEIF